MTIADEFQKSFDYLAAGYAALEVKGATLPSTQRLAQLAATIDTLDEPTDVPLTVAAGDGQIDVTEPAGKTRSIFIQPSADNPTTGDWTRHRAEIPYSITGLTNDVEYRLDDGIAPVLRTPSAPAAAEGIVVLEGDAISGETGTGNQFEHVVSFDSAGDPVLIVFHLRSGVTSEQTPAVHIGDAERTFGTGTSVTRFGVQSRSNAQVHLYLISEPGTGLREVHAQASANAFASEVIVIRLSGLIGTPVVDTSLGGNSSASTRSLSVSADAGQMILVGAFWQGGFDGTDNPSFEVDLSPEAAFRAYDTSLYRASGDPHPFDIRYGLALVEASTTKSYDFVASVTNGSLCNIWSLVMSGDF